MTYSTLLQTCPNCGGGGGMGGWGMGAGGLWALVWMLPLLFLVAAVVLGAVYLLTRRDGTADADPAMELLREQYARGEISDEEFEERAARLADDPSVRSPPGR